MKYIKKYQKKNIPIIGDYVVVIPNDDLDIELKYFINNNIGKVIKLYHYHSGEIAIRAAFDNVPDELKEWFGYDHATNKETMSFSTDQIIKISKYKKDLEHLIISNKYNL